MADALKDAYNKDFIAQLSDEIQRHHPSLDAKEFHSLVFNNEWKRRELKSRMQHISRCLHQSLNMDFVNAIEVLRRTAPVFGGFEAMIFPDYVEQFGQEHWDVSMEALEELTQYSSAEFAVRPFILIAPDAMMAQMQQWSNHSNHHVRRLASEGCRPRLPWAMSLPLFKNDPLAILPILENLKQDSSDYVRRSVANNLNDIAKDNPDIALKTASAWHNQHPDTDWIIKHGLRTLLKQGNKDALALIGTHRSDHIKRAVLTIENKRPSIGEDFYLQADISGGATALGKLRIDYHIDFVKKMVVSPAKYLSSRKEITQKKTGYSEKNIRFVK